MNWLRSILFSCAGIILFLHALVAHDHHTSDSIGHPEYQTEASIFDQIALGFHISQHDGHLEDFTPDPPQIDFSPEFVAVVASLFELNFTRTYFPAPSLAVEQTAVRWHSPTISGFSHRGPPLI